MKSGRIASFNPGIASVKLVSMLNRALQMELQAILQYGYYKNVLVGPASEPVRELLGEIIGQEQHHAEEFADWVVALGGHPASDPITPIVPEPVTSIDDILMAVAAAETEALKFYDSIRDCADECAHTGIVVFIEHVMEEESQHYNSIRRNSSVDPVVRQASSLDDHKRFDLRKGPKTMAVLEGDAVAGKLFNTPLSDDVRQVALNGQGSDVVLQEDTVKDKNYKKTGPLNVFQLEDQDFDPNPSGALSKNQKERAKVIRKELKDVPAPVKKDTKKTLKEDKAKNVL